MITIKLKMNHYDNRQSYESDNDLSECACAFVKLIIKFARQLIDAVK